MIILNNVYSIKCIYYYLLHYSMTKSIIAVFVITLILFSSTLMTQKIYGTEEDLPFPKQWGGTGSEKAIPDWVKTTMGFYLKVPNF